MPKTDGDEMTSNKEEYLKTIYENGGINQPVSNKTISDALGVAPSSVTEMLIKLKKEGLITSQPYKGSMLTDTGVEVCLNVIRSCGLWEVFLVQHLGYSWREAYEDAHLLEHVTTTRLMDRLDTFLGHPTTCPHGSLIPQKDKMNQPMTLIRLSDLGVGDKGIIRRVAEDRELLDYLERIGLHLDQDIAVVEGSDYEGSILFLQAGQRRNISFKAAQSVYVEVLSEEANKS